MQNRNRNIDSAEVQSEQNPAATTGVTSTTAELAKKLNPAAPATVVESKPVYDVPHHCVRPSRPDDPPTPPGYVRRQSGITGNYYYYQPVEDYHTDLLLNYS